MCPVAEGHCEVPRGCLYFYSLFFTALDALPCPCIALPLPLPCSVSNLPFVVRDRRRKLHRERSVFFFPSVARDRRRKLHREWSVFFFPFAARDMRRKLHRELFFFFFPRGRFCGFGFHDSWRWSQVRWFACGRDG